MHAHAILIKPIVTEKSMSGVDQGKYTFAVKRFATKDQIKDAIKKAFNVTVVSISTSMTKGRKHRVGAKRLEVADTQWKRAIVKLKPGEKISLFEPGAGAEEKKK